MKKIPLTRGQFALVDDTDYAALACWKWNAVRSKKSNTFYASRISYTPRRTRLMHREILGVPASIGVDHRDGNGLDNQRKNLRPATHQQNLSNQRPRSGGTSRFKGVCWGPRLGKWRAYIRKNYKQIWLGDFSDEIKAAEVYDAAALKHFGQFARPNFSP